MRNTLLIIDCGSTKVPLIEQKLADLDQRSVTISWDSITSSDAIGYSGIIVSGAPILITKTNPQPYLDQLNFLLDHPFPILGICFGHQVLGMLHGAKAFECEPVRTNMTIDKRGESLIFSEIDDFSFNQDHCEAIDLPENWIHLASSRVCLNEAMEHPYKSVFGVQFHPESSGENGTQLLKNFCKSCL